MGFLGGLVLFVCLFVGGCDLFVGLFLFCLFFVLFFLVVVYVCVVGFLLVKNILSQSTELFNGQTMYYLKMYTFDLPLNLSYITIYVSPCLPQCFTY